MKDEWERFFTSGRIEDYLQAKQMEKGSVYLNSKEETTDKHDALSKAVNAEKDNNSICRIM